MYELTCKLQVFFKDNIEESSIYIYFTNNIKDVIAANEF